MDESRRVPGNAEGVQRPEVAGPNSPRKALTEGQSALALATREQRIRLSSRHPKAILPPS